MTHAPMVSIIVPVYNAQDTLTRCVDSIAGQTYRDIEIILVNDGSRDSSGCLCEEYATRYPFVRAIQRENGGESAARNTGVEYASGTYIQFVDSDDFLEPDTTRCLVEAKKSSEAGLVVCAFSRVVGGVAHPAPLGIQGVWPWYRQLMEFGQGVPDALLRFGSSCNKLYIRDLITRYALRFEETRRANEDAHFNFAYIKHIDSIFFVDMPLYNYTVPDSRATVTTAYRPQAFEMNERVYTAIEEAVGAKYNAKERSVFNRHYIDKTLIVLKMLCRPNDIYTDDRLREMVHKIACHPRVRTALADCWPEGTQDNQAVEWLRECDCKRLYAWAVQGGQRLYGG